MKMSRRDSNFVQFLREAKSVPRNLSFSSGTKFESVKLWLLVFSGHRAEKITQKKCFTQFSGVDKNCLAILC